MDFTFSPSSSVEVCWRTLGKEITCKICGAVWPWAQRHRRPHSRCAGSKPDEHRRRAMADDALPLECHGHVPAMHARGSHLVCLTCPDPAILVFFWAKRKRREDLPKKTRISSLPNPWNPWKRREQRTKKQGKPQNEKKKTRISPSAFMGSFPSRNPVESSSLRKGHGEVLETWALETSKTCAAGLWFRNQTPSLAEFCHFLVGQARPVFDPARRFLDSPIRANRFAEAIRALRIDSRESLEGSRSEPPSLQIAFPGTIKLRIAGLRRLARIARALWK